MDEKQELNVNPQDHQTKYELLKSIVYNSKPLRWKLRKALLKEKEYFEKELSKLEQNGVEEKVIQKNKETINLLEELTETFRPALIHHHPLEELKKENKKAVKNANK